MRALICVCVACVSGSCCAGRGIPMALAVRAPECRGQAGKAGGPHGWLGGGPGQGGQMRACTQHAHAAPTLRRRGGRLVLHVRPVVDVTRAQSWAWPGPLCSRALGDTGVTQASRGRASQVIGASAVIPEMAYGGRRSGTGSSLGAQWDGGVPRRVGGAGACVCGRGEKQKP